MSHDKDVMILSWLNSQPSGFAYAKDIPLGNLQDIDSLESRGLIVRVPGREPDDPHGYVITEKGKRYQEGD